MSEQKPKFIYFEDIVDLVIGIAFGVMLYALIAPVKIKEVPVPIKVETKTTDSFYITKDSIIYKIKYITEIQHDTIEKVYALNDSSTLELFYKLVSE